MAFVDTERTNAGLSEATAGDFIALLKPRVMSLVVFTAAVGLFVAPTGLGPALSIVAILCIAVGAGASGSLNMWYDADIDAIMSRTAKRPVPTGKVAPGEALTFGLVLSAISVITMGIFVNWLAAALLAFTIFFYAVIYTMWLKRSTPQNIVIGGAAGAFPPMIGWAAATGAISLESVILFLIIFLWTPPHFWALALFKEGDYERAGIPMMPNVAGPRSTKRQMYAYTLVVAAVGVLPWALGFAGITYGLIAGLLGAAFIWHAHKVLMSGDGEAAYKPAKAMFGFSLIYLFALFAVLLGEVVVTRTMALMV
ncbi:MAG: heme o synthase [Rhizobiaceae bacterium]